SSAIYLAYSDCSLLSLVILPPRLPSTLFPYTTLFRSCDYWRYCGVDGFLCTCCGGTATSCPPGAEPSPIAWVGTCHNPKDGKDRSEEHTSELQSRFDLVCRLLLEKRNKNKLILTFILC